ncbi:pirin family protein [Acidocella facilis]|uniref:pirin family protein n=1 Tax=Acidocella facilis TaxID=525 RepID=UPI00047DA0E7|nr:pirin family protein [Acidocella facilis]
MIEHRPFKSLGGANHGWLDAKHHFSFASYHDSARMGWGRLRVWNDDHIEAGAGFPPHPHENMEIITYVRKGAITHRDNLGNHGRTEAGDVQVMSAGTGITHSEFNLENEATELFQIWILPSSRGHAPSWGTRPFPKDGREGKFVTLASGFAEDAEALKIHAEARLSGGTLKKGERITYDLTPERHAYLVPATGKVSVNGLTLNERDGAAITGETSITIEALEDAELVLVDAA